MISVDQAYQTIFEVFTQTQATQKVAINDSLNHILQEDIIADRDSPPFDKAMMDGFAFSSKALLKGILEFQVTGLQSAGESPKKINQENEALEIATGAPLPINTDCVIPYENIIPTQHQPAYPFSVRPNQAVKVMGNVQARGKEYRTNDLLLHQGSRINSRHITTLAAVGKEEINVQKTPAIGVIVTGEELVEIGQKPLPWQIRASNGIMISTFLKEWGFLNVTTLKVGDHLEELTEAIQNYIAKKDWVLITGSLSKGKKDFVPNILDAAKTEKKFHRVKQKPGKPFLFATKKNELTHKETLIFGLPGNPISALVCLRRYVLASYFEGLKKTLPKLCLEKIELKVKVDETIKFNKPLTYFPLVKLHRPFIDKVTPVVYHGSGDFHSLVHSDGFIEIPSHLQSTDEMESFRFYPWVLQ